RRGHTLTSHEGRQEPRRRLTQHPVTLLRAGRAPPARRGSACLRRRAGRRAALAPAADRPVADAEVLSSVFVRQQPAGDAAGNTALDIPRALRGTNYGGRFRYALPCA